MPFRIAEEDSEFLGLQDSEMVLYNDNYSYWRLAFIKLSDLIRRILYFSENIGFPGIRTYYEALFSGGWGQRVVVQTLHLIFSFFPKSFTVWRYTDTLLAMVYSLRNPMDGLAGDADIVIYAANWGEASFLMARSKQHRAVKNVLMPYTSDQIFATGFLLGNFKLICPQSELENSFLSSLHNYYHNDREIVGSLWFRNVDYFLSNDLVRPLQGADILVFAGVSSEFFPKKSEVNFVNDFKRNNPGYSVYYYPIANEQEKSWLNKNVVDGIKVAMPSVTIMGTSSVPVVSVKKEIVSHLEKLYGAKIFVMSFGTTMSLDYAYLMKRNIYSYFYDSQDFVRNSRYANMERQRLVGKHYSEITWDKTHERDFDLSTVEESANEMWDHPFDLEQMPLLLRGV